MKLQSIETLMKPAQFGTLAHPISILVNWYKQQIETLPEGVNNFEIIQFTTIVDAWTDETKSSVRKELEKQNVPTMRSLSFNYQTQKWID